MASTNVGSIHYDLTLDKSKFDKGASSVSNKMNKLGASALALTKKIAKVGAAMGAAFTAFGLKTAGDLESARMGFVTLLGSAEEADKTMARIKKEAARTPFEIPGLTTATQLLSSVTKDGDRAIDFLLDVGEGLAAMGKGQSELDRIIVNLQQIGAVGKASMIDIKQFAFAGIPIFDMLKESTGKTGEALQDMIKDGEITFELLEEMFQDATEEGGRFFNAFTNQSGTFNQSLSNMKDTFAIFAADFVEQTGLFDIAKDAMKGISDWVVENKDKIIDFAIEAGKKMKEWGERIFEVAKQIANYLAPKLENLWEKIVTKVIPALKDLWESGLKDVAYFAGVVLIGALGLLIDTFAFLADNIEWVMPVLVAFGALLISAKVLGAINTVVGGITGAGGVVPALGKFATKLGLPALITPWGLIAAAATGMATVIVLQSDKAKRALDGIARKSDDAYDNLKKYHSEFERTGDLDKWKRHLKLVSDQTYIAGRNALIAKEHYSGLQGFVNWALGVKPPSWVAGGGGGGGGFAAGGVPPVGVPSLVGEEGPELFVPHQRGTIIPADKTKNILENSNNNSTMNISSLTVNNQADIMRIERLLGRKQELAQLGFNV